MKFSKVAFDGHTTSQIASKSWKVFVQSETVKSYRNWVSNFEVSYCVVSKRMNRDFLSLGMLLLLCARSFISKNVSKEKEKYIEKFCRV